MRGRQYFALIFILSIVVAAILTLPGASLAQPPGVFTPTPFATFTPIPLFTPSPTPAAPGCDAGSFAIPIGSTITLRPGVNIRSAPSISAPWLASFEENKIFYLSDGPVCGDGYFWWKIRGHGVNGWVAERDNAQSFIRFFDPPPGTVCTADPLNLVAGEEIDLLVGVRIRRTPGLDGLVLTVAPADSVATVLSNETTCVDGFNWREVRVTVVDFTYDGWMAEGSRDIPELRYVDIELEEEQCISQQSFATGERVRVGYRDRNPKNLRVAPSLDAEIMYMLVENVPLVIVGGPVCSDGMNWWQVRVLSNIPATGWVGEGGRGNIWLRRTTLNTGR